MCLPPESLTKQSHHSKKFLLLCLHSHFSLTPQPLAITALFSVLIVLSFPYLSIYHLSIYLSIYKYILFQILYIYIHTHNLNMQPFGSGLFRKIHLISVHVVYELIVHHFYCWIMFHYINMPQFVYIFSG